MLEIRDVIRDPIYGYIRLTDLELKIINGKIFQRLRHIKQAPGVGYVYPGGAYSRFLHSVGSCHLAGRVCDEIGIPRDKDKQKIRLAALLHDIGHGPFSHVFDDFLGKKGVEVEGKSLTHETVGRILVENTEIADILKEGKFKPEEIIEIAFLNKNPEEAISQNYVIEKEIVSGWFDIDKLDFLVRDAYFCGVEYGSLDVERIVSNLVNFRNRLSLKKRAIWAFETLYIQRWNMFRAVYFHRTVRAWETQLLELLLALDEVLKVSETMERMFIDGRKAEDFAPWISMREDVIMSQLLGLLESGEYKKHTDAPELLYRHLMGVVHRDREHLIRSITPFETHDLFGRDLSKMPGTVSGVKEDLSTKANEFVEGEAIDPEKHMFVDTPILSKIPTRIKPEGSPPILNDNQTDFYELPAHYLYNKIESEITFSSIFTFPEYVDAVQRAYDDKFKKSGQKTSF